jgi:predicted cupin superfamily sugar epimerase
VTNAVEVVRLLGLEPHPEGGMFAETWRAPTQVGERASGTAIYFLLRAGERSQWHRVDAAEIWHFYAGHPLELSTSPDGVAVSQRVLGPELAAGQRPQLMVPAGVWQAARSLGDWTLVGCTVAPGFEYRGLELAPEGWEPLGT